jgi:hypothetical protein
MRKVGQPLDSAHASRFLPSTQQPGRTHRHADDRDRTDGGRIVSSAGHRLRTLSLAFVLAFGGAQAGDDGETVRLTDLIFHYRAENGLTAIPLSPTLSRVASLHVDDLERHPPRGRCNTHSWSANGTWTPCCYTRDHAQARCMWDKPREISRGAYTAQGFEIVCHDPGGMTAQAAMACWRRSRQHHDVLLNRGSWRDRPWRAMGVAVSAHYAVVWLGEAPER